MRCLQSHVSDHISFKARREVREQFAQDHNLMQLGQTDPEQYQIAFDNAVATAVAEITESLVMAEMKARQGQQDPLVRLKQQEIDLEHWICNVRKREKLNLKQINKMLENKINYNLITTD
ncbi:MAG: hypothetical protein CM15mV124_180 [uncultured marine virus]|nr:MAG: hypothetical protein CM15mV124_180 [uncultured marine virus]